MCTCSQYPPLDLSRASISKRIKATKTILKPLALLATNDALKLKLFQCPQCAQYWQTGWEWGFGCTEYAFQVPAIAVTDWQNEPYGQPAAWLIYTVSMEDYYAKNTFEPSGKLCQMAQCTHHAIKLSGVCEQHHIEQLQQFGLLPKRPMGRIFPPYHPSAPV